MGKRLSHEQAEAVMLRANLKPLDQYPGARTGWRCQCMSCGAEVTPTYDNVRHRGTGCWECGKRRIGDALRGNAHDASAEIFAAGRIPVTPYKTVDSPWRSICMTCGREGSPTLWTVRSRGLSCGYCAGNRISVEDAIATMSAQGWEPLEPYPGRAVTPWRCRCETCGKEASPSYNSAQQGKGCIYCAGHRIDPINAEETMLGAGLTPKKPYPGGHVPWECECQNCGLLVRPTYSSVNAGRGGCVRCGHEKTAEARRIPEERAVELMRAAGVEPLVPYPGADEPWRATCAACGNEVAPRLDGIKNRGQGACLFCADSGFKRDNPGFVYLTVSEALNALKVGVRNEDSFRIAEHQRHGWDLVAEWRFQNGGSAIALESAVLDWWRRDLGAGSACEAYQMPQRGHTETASWDDVSVEGTVTFVKNWIESAS